MVRPHACSGSGTDRTTVRSRRRRLHPAAATKCRPRRHQPPLGRLTPRPAQVRSLQAIEDHCTTLSFHVATSRSECVDFIAHNVVEDTQLKTLSAFITIAFVQLFGITTAAITAINMVSCSTSSDLQIRPRILYGRVSDKFPCNCSDVCSDRMQ